MTYQRMTLTLTPEEKSALVAIARSELRDPRSQLRQLVRDAAEKRGLSVAPAMKSEVQSEKS